MNVTTSLMKTNLGLNLCGAGCQVSITMFAIICNRGVKRGLQTLEVVDTKLQTVTFRVGDITSTNSSLLLC